MPLPNINPQPDWADSMSDPLSQTAEQHELSQAELLCYQPAHELCRPYRKHDLVETVTNVIIIMLVFLVIGILLWVNTKGWDLPLSRRSPGYLYGRERRGRGDVEGLLGKYRDGDTDDKSDNDTEKGYGHGREKGYTLEAKMGKDEQLDPVERFVEMIRRLAVEGKVRWKTFEEVQWVWREQRQARDGRGRRIIDGDGKDTPTERTE